MTVYTKVVNGVRRNLTSEEIAELETMQNSLSEIKAQKIEHIKLEAGRRIVAAYPEWKQRNHMAAIADIHNKELVGIKTNVPYILSADELVTVTAAQSAKDEIFAIRAKSDELETSLDSMTTDQLKVFNPSNDSNWV